MVSKAQSLSIQASSASTAAVKWRILLPTLLGEVQALHCGCNKGKRTSKVGGEENCQKKSQWTSNPCSISGKAPELHETWATSCTLLLPYQDLITFCFPRHDSAVTANLIPTLPVLSGDGPRAGEEHIKAVKHSIFLYYSLRFLTSHCAFRHKDAPIRASTLTYQ